MAPVYRKIWDFFDAGDMKNAARYQSEVSRIIHKFLRYESISAQKYLMSKIGSVCGGPRRPLAELGLHEMLELDDLVAIIETRKAELSGL